MEEELPCPLCESASTLLYHNTQRTYYRCANCLSAFLHPSQRLSFAEEKRRYELHNNDVHDQRYQKFVTPLVERIVAKHAPEDQGLDFGAGTGPVISKLLKDQGYQISMYDPFFWDDHHALEKTYDYIVLCEVIEHFYHPRKSFSLLRSLLNPSGTLFCRTSLFTETVDFPTWYYKNDETHTFYYHPQSIRWIAEFFGFQRFTITDDTIIEFSLTD